MDDLERSKLRIGDMLELLSNEICDNYCKWHDLVSDEDELMKRCDDWPLVKYL